MPAQPPVWLTAGCLPFGFDLPEQPLLFVAHALCGGECLSMLDWRAVVQSAVLARHTLVTDAQEGRDRTRPAHPWMYRRRACGLEAPFAEGQRCR
jgi:hypothetical protein